MSTLRFQIQHSNGRQEQITVESERALIGSGAHCEIRLPIDQAAVEHVLIQVGAAGVFAQALHFEPAPTIANVPFTQAPLPPEAVLGVGQTQMLVTLSDLGAGGGKKKEQKTNPVLLILAAIAIPGALLMLNAEEPGPPPLPDEAPLLWDPAPPTCDRAGTEALTLANEKRVLADSKRERRMFHLRDGVEAVPLYDLAGACYERGSETALAKESRELAKDLRKEMDDEYRTHRMRLKHALSVNDLETARKETRVLLDLLQGRQGPYVDRLNNLDRELKQKLGKPT